MTKTIVSSGRTEHAFVVFNKFPYNNGHLLIAPNRHIADFSDASDEELLCIMHLIRDCQNALSLAIAPHGFNIGMNFGRCAGAGLPDHVHVHVVPRWERRYELYARLQRHRCD